VCVRARFVERSKTAIRQGNTVNGNAPNYIDTDNNILITAVSNGNDTNLP
jgi:hypothetical protein